MVIWQKQTKVFKTIVQNVTKQFMDGVKMGMSKKHYEMIASVISLNKGRDSIIAGLASKFVNDNPRFDEDKFKEECRK